MNERADILERTKLFSLRVIRMYSAGDNRIQSHRDPAFRNRGAMQRRQRSRSQAEIKTEVALQELEETIYWMELLVESGIVKARRLC